VRAPLAVYQCCIHQLYAGGRARRLGPLGAAKYTLRWVSCIIYHIIALTNHDLAGVEGKALGLARPRNPIGVASHPTGTQDRARASVTGIIRMRESLRASLTG
jgi:hypothetical protein